MKHPEYSELPIIEGQTVRLRPITFEDTVDIVRWRSDPDVWRFFLFREPFTPEMHENWLTNKVMTGQVIQYIIVDRESGKSTGSVYLRDIDYINESAEFGIFIGEAHARNRGIGTETARIITDFGFHVLGLHRIFLRVLAGNEAARRSYEKASFKTEGIFRDFIKLDDEFTDMVFMARLNGEGDV